MEKTEGLDNQQAITQKEIGWICGFFDGEGYVGMNISPNYSAKKIKTNRNTIIVPRLCVANTDYGTIMKFADIAKRCGVGTYIGKKRRYSPKHTPCYELTINGHKRCRKFIPFLLKECITKKSALEAMKTWLDYREKSAYQYSLTDYNLYQDFMRASGKSPNDSTLRRLYNACIAPIYKERSIPSVA